MFTLVVALKTWASICTESQIYVCVAEIYAIFEAVFVTFMVTTICYI